MAKGDPLCRRRLLLTSCASVALLALGGPLAADDRLARFMARSRALTGLPDLDRGLGEGLLAGFQAMGRASPSDAELLEAWYSGNSGGEVVSYTEAAIWQVLTFTKPQGYCGGALGYWGEPPA